MKARLVVCILLFLITYPYYRILALSNSESLVKRENIVLIPDQTNYQLSFSPIVVNSETIVTDQTPLLKSLDYDLDYKTGTLILLRPQSDLSVSISYLVLPNTLTNKLFVYERMDNSDSLQIAKRRTNPFWAGDDSRLTINGSKTFALTFSDDRDFDLKQSLFVNLSGELADNINIEAQLSDSQSKLSPEGDSKELSNLDQVYVKVYGKEYEIAMGDLDLEFINSKYMKYQTKIEGINLSYSDRHAMQLAYSASSGKRTSQQINIIDGKQGPYYLRAGTYQQNYIIIAGSERIYIDGRLSERGSDYSIDYSEGSVMFRNVITSSNSVIAYFHYSDENYKQSMYLSTSRIAISDQLSFGYHLIHQQDNKDNPLQYEFSPADIDSLRASGDSAVWGGGIFEVEPGSGSYIKITGFDGTEYYEYAPMDTTAAYNLIFSYVGFGNGDYDQFSSGKFTFVGTNNGSWLPVKRLIPPVKRTNVNAVIDYSTEVIDFGIEALYSHQDKNTFSKLDEADNDSHILYLYGVWKADWDRLRSRVKLDFEKRAAHSFLFGNYYDPSIDFDFVGLSTADSLAQYQGNLQMSAYVGSIWTPEINLRIRSIDNYYDQKALRFNSKTVMYSLFPETNLQSTISEQVYADSSIGVSLLQYHSAYLAWQKGLFRPRFDALYNSLVYTSDSTLSLPGTEYYKLNPSLGIIIGKQSSTNVSYTYDKNSLKTEDWTPINSSQSYAIRHASAFQMHHIDLSFTHREVSTHSQSSLESAKSRYDLINARSSNTFWKQAISILSNYQLNQTEFFPRIRELQYIGSGLGLYDSTGVYTSSGDYDYNYIISETGTLSTELNGAFYLYFKPANISTNPLFQRFMTDTNVQATEQRSNSKGFGHYLFLPGHVYTSEHTIYGRQNFQQNLSFDIIRNRANGRMQYEVNRTLDQRYQSLSRSLSDVKAIEIELRNIAENNFRFRFENQHESDTRYNSDIIKYTFSSRGTRNLNLQTALQLDLDIVSENGSGQNISDDYELRSFVLIPSIRSVWQQKYRISASYTMKHNQRKGSDYLTFLPDKRDGFISLWSLQAIYRLNSYTSSTIEYSGNAYPKDRTRHQLKIEFKAEL